MAVPPQFEGPDGVLREELVFTTTRPTRFLYGSVDPSTVSVQVAVRGGIFESDPDMVFFSGGTFTIPNPSSFPDGIDLVDGENLVEVRSVDSAGYVSAPSRARVTLVQESALGLVVQPPTSISVERRDSKVEIRVEGVRNRHFRGINVYASPFPGGGSTGYLPINVSTVVDYSTREVESPLASLPVRSLVILGPDGKQAADPHLVNVVATQRDGSGNVLQMDFNETLELPEDVRRISYNVQVNRVRVVNTYVFEHNRGADQSSTPATIPQSDFSPLLDSDPLYYVATAVYFDASKQMELESPFSPEVSASPLRITAGEGSFPLVSQKKIVSDMSLAVYRSQPTLRIDPGSVLRDTVIDPVSLEISQVRFILDFLHRAQSFGSLLRIDDPSLSGSSIPVSQSSYKIALKQAFKLQLDDDVQEMIDQAFEMQSSRYGVTRLPGSKARGEVSIYTTRRPDATIQIPIGTIVSGGGVRFRTTEAAAITLESVASFFSGETGRYSVRVAVQAERVGSSGNLAPGQIRSVVSGPSGLSVVNENRTFGGQDVESNRDLATRAQNALSSVDSGTISGITKMAVETPGVSEVKVVTPGDAMMQRDFDELSQRHVGGKVDVWVRGTRVNTITDTFAFSFDISRNVLFDVVGDPADLRFRVSSGVVSSDNPLVEMLDIEDLGFGLRNDSTGEWFDLTNCVIEDFDLVRLDGSVYQPQVSFAHVVRGDIRFRTGNSFTFPRQPVTRVNYLAGASTGTLDRSLYSLERLSDPLKEGRSTIAGDRLRVTSTPPSLPSGSPISVVGESHVIIGEVPEFLGNLGVNPATIRVFNSSRTVEYAGPYSPAGSSVDFLITDGDARSPASIRRSATGSISSGQTLLIDYKHDENFVVSYDTNFVVTSVQTAVDDKRHATADILVKEAVISTVDITATVVLSRGAKPSVVDGRIRTNLTNYMRGLGLGAPLRPSDVVGVMEGTQGVSHVMIPFTKMVLSEGSQVLRETLSGGFLLIPSWSTSHTSVYISRSPLTHTTTTGGGPANEFCGVFLDDVLLDVQRVSPSTLGNGPGRSYIVGGGGLSIPGYSDDAHLLSLGFSVGSSTTERKRLTANRVILSMNVGDNPDDRVASVSYWVGVDSGVKSIEVGVMESLSLGDLNITYDEDRFG